MNSCCISVGESTSKDQGREEDGERASEIEGGESKDGAASG